MCIGFFTDIDECINGTHNCSQICTNTDGSFTCGCNEGYELNIDDVTCNGLYKICVYVYTAIHCIVLIIMITRIL